MIKIWPNIKLYSAVLLVFIGLIIYRIFNYTYASYDCGYYLSVARDMYRGNTFFTDIAVSYNPLGIVMLGLPYLFTENTTFAMHVFVNILFIILGSFVLFRILRRLKTSIHTALFFCLLYIAITLNYDGNIIMLEPFSVLFQLCGLYFFINVLEEKKVIQSIFLSGVFISLAFLSKQFGLFLLLPTGVYLLLNRTALIKRIAIFGLGVASPLVILYLFYAAKGVALMQYVSFILGKGVALDFGNGTGLIDIINTTGIVNFIIATIFLVLIPFYLKKTTLQKSEALFYILLPISALSVFIFANYNHYFQYLTPYLIILFVVALNTSQQKLKPIINQIALIISVAMVVFLSLKTLKLQKRNSKYLMKGLAIVEQEVPKGSTVFLSRISPAFYYLLDYKSISLDKIGYTFPEYYKTETILSNLSKGDYLILTESYYNKYKAFGNQFKQKKIHFRDQDLYIFVKK